MTDVLHTIRLTRGQTIELTEGEACDLRDALTRLYPPPSVLAPLVPQAPSPIWPPPLPPSWPSARTGDPLWPPATVTCGGANA